MANTKTRGAKKPHPPKILLIDIETVPGKAYIWSMWDTGVPLDRLIEPGRMVCAALKWHKKKGITFVSEWTHTTKEMLTIIRDALTEADAVITFNGDKFDLPRLRGEFVKHRIKPAAPVTSIDLYKTVKKLGYQSGKLEFVGPFLDVGAKVKNEGFRLWKGVMAGDPGARKRMEKYNKQDTRLMGGLYERLKPYMTTHPRLHDFESKHSCSTCGSTHVTSQGHRRTKAFKVERLQCQTCGAWDTGTRTKIGSKRK
jgi:hypothetical protein